MLELTFIRSLDDHPSLSPEYQKGLRSFADSIEAEGILAIEAKSLDKEGGEPIMFSGSFLLNAVSAQAKRGVIAWLKDRPGRQVRVGVGPEGHRPTAEADTGEEVERLLSKAEEFIVIMRKIGTNKAPSEGPQEIEPRQLKLHFVPSPDDALREHSAYQLELEELEQSLSSQGLETSRLIELRESVDGGPIMGDFVIKLASIVGPALCTLLESGFMLGTAARSVCVSEISRRKPKPWRRCRNFSLALKKFSLATSRK